MRNKMRVTGDAPIAGVNIVPVIDLCLVLLVILLIVSPMLDAPSLDVKLPQARTTEEKENNISVWITPDGKMGVNSEIIAAEDLPKILPALLREQGEDVVVVIRADKNVSYGSLTELLKTIKAAGAQRISLGTEQPKESQK